MVGTRRRHLVLLCLVAVCSPWYSGCGKTQEQALEELREQARRDAEIRKKREQERAEFTRQHFRRIEELSKSDRAAFGAVVRLSRHLPLYQYDLMAYAWNDPEAFRKAFCTGDLGAYLRRRPDGIGPTTIKPISEAIPDPEWDRVREEAQRAYREHAKGFAERLKENGYNKIPCP